MIERYLAHLKSGEEIEDGIRRLLSIRSHDKDAYNKFYDVILNYLHPIPFPIVDVIPNLPLSIFYRTRSNDKPGEWYSKITEISSHNDLENIKSYGRCNIPHQSTFYCAENRETAVFEVLKKNDFKRKKLILTTGRWRLKEKMTLGFLVHSDEALNANPVLKEEYDKFSSIIDNLEPSQKIVIVRLLKFISDYFARPFGDKANNEYKLSAAFYNYFLNYVDGLIYPSVKILYKGLNYAFDHDKFLNNIIELDRALINVANRDIEDPLSYTEGYGTEDRGILKESNFIRWNTQSLQKI